MAARVKVDAGVCGFQTEIVAAAEYDYGPVTLAVTTDCPHVPETGG